MEFFMEFSMEAHPWKIISFFTNIDSNQLLVIFDIFKIKVDLICLGGGVVIMGQICC